MEVNGENLILLYKQYLKRAAWRLQYKMKTQNYRESIPLLDNAYIDYKCESEIVSKLYIKELLNTLTSNKEQYVITRIVIQGATEKEVAKELKISQQGVNKCKRKALETLRKKVNLL